MPRGLCFVLMPFGKKPDASGSLVDFDAVYHDLIASAIRHADLDSLRADAERWNHSQTDGLRKSSRDAPTNSLGRRVPCCNRSIPRSPSR
jgi:hypothetical protein